MIGPCKISPSDPEIRFFVHFLRSRLCPKVLVTTLQCVRLDVKVTREEHSRAIDRVKVGQFGVLVTLDI
jgi:hypothetical protein